MAGGGDVATSLVSRFLSIFGARVVLSLLSILSLPFIVRLLGPSDYGDYAVLLSIFSLYMIPVSSGVTEGIQKYVAEERTPEWRQHVIRFYFGLGGLLAVAGAVVLLAVTWLGIADRAFGPPFTVYFSLLAGLVVLGQFRALAYRTVLGMGLEHLSEPLSILKKSAIVGFGLGLVVAGYGVTGMLVGHLVANALVIVGGGYVIARRIDLGGLLSRPPASFPRRELLSFNGLNILLVLFVMSLFHVDVIMVRSLLDSEQTGYYNAALALAEYLWFVPLALQTLLLHSSARLWSEERFEKLTELTSKVLRYTVLLVVLLAIGIGALADRFIPLYYGPSFAVAVIPLLFLLPGTVAFAAARPLQAITQGSGQLKPLVAAAGTSAGINAGLNALFIPSFGLIGAAAATGIGYTSMFVLLVLAARHLGINPLADARTGRVALTALISAPVIVATTAVIRQDIIALVVVPPLGLVVYGALALKLGALDLAEILDILEEMPAPIRTVSERIRGAVSEA